MKYPWVIIWLTVAATISHAVDEEPHTLVLHDPLTTCLEEEEACARDRVAFNAISELHSQLDEDKDGEVDPSEADEFVRDELKYTDDFERTNTLHKHDQHISKLELWNAWKNSEVYNWTTEMVQHWLIHHVQLPQYADSFRDAGVSGPDVPRLAVSNMKYMSNVLHIKNAVHKQKIILKAIDLILFGPPKSFHSPWKDLSVVVTILLLAGGCWYAMVQNRYSRRHIARMNDKLEQLIKAEQSLKELPAKLANACQEHSDGQHTEECRSRKDMTREMERIQDERVQARGDCERLRLAEEELEYMSDLKNDLENEVAMLRRHVHQLQEQLAAVPSMGGGIAPGHMAEVQLLLQLCCEAEKQHLQAKRAAVINTLNAVKEEHMKLTKKKASFIGAIRLDVSGNMDHIESRISDAKDAVYDVKRSLTEHQNRWAQVERLMHFSILTNPGVKVLQATLSELKTSASSANLLHTSRQLTSRNSYENLLGGGNAEYILGSQYSLSNPLGGGPGSSNTEPRPNRGQWGSSTSSHTNHFSSTRSSSNDTLDRLDSDPASSPPHVVTRYQEPLSKGDLRASLPNKSSAATFRSVAMVTRVALGGNLGQSGSSSPSTLPRNGGSLPRNVTTSSGDRTASIDSSTEASEMSASGPQTVADTNNSNVAVRPSSQPVFTLDDQPPPTTSPVEENKQLNPSENGSSSPTGMSGSRIPMAPTLRQTKPATIPAAGSVAAPSVVAASTSAAAGPANPSSVSSLLKPPSVAVNVQMRKPEDIQAKANTLQLPHTDNASHESLSSTSGANVKTSPKSGRKSPSLRSLRLPIFHRHKHNKAEKS